MMILRAFALLALVSYATAASFSLRGSSNEPRQLAPAVNAEVYCQKEIADCRSKPACALCLRTGVIPPPPKLTPGGTCVALREWFASLRFPATCDYKTAGTPLADQIYCLYDSYALLGGEPKCEGTALRTHAPTMAPSMAPTSAPVMA